jgi:hypothetical protein
MYAGVFKVPMSNELQQYIKSLASNDVERAIKLDTFTTKVLWGCTIGMETTPLQ